MQQLFFKLFLLVSFRGKKKVREPRPDWSPLGVNFKILDEHPHLFNIQVHPPPPLREILQTDFFFQISTNVPATRVKVEEPVSTRSTVFVVFAQQDMEEKLVKQVMSAECCLLYYVHYKVTRLCPIAKQALFNWM